MNIDFTGIKNIGYLNRKFTTGNSEEESGCKTTYDQKYLTVQLKDDYYGNDLTEFKKALSSSDLVGALNPIGNDFLNISIDSETYEEDMIKDSVVNYYINDKELEINDKNLKLIGVVSRLLKRISETPEDKLVYNRDFVNGDDSDNAIVLNENLMESFGPIYFNVKNSIYSPTQVIKGSGVMFKDL